MNNIRVLGIVGSSRRESVNATLLREAGRIVQESGGKFEMFDVSNRDFPLYDQDLEAEVGFPARTTALREAVRGADVLLFASPEHNAGYSALLKSMIDWGSRRDPETGVENVWEGKLGGLMAASPGAFGGSRGLIALRQTLAHVRVLVIPEFTVVPAAYEAFTDDGRLKNERSEKELRHMIDRLLGLAKQTRA